MCGIVYCLATKSIIRVEYVFVYKECCVCLCTNMIWVFIVYFMDIAIFKVHNFDKDFNLSLNFFKYITKILNTVPEIVNENWYY